MADSLDFRMETSPKKPKTFPGTDTEWEAYLRKSGVELPGQLEESVKNSSEELGEIMALSDLRKTSKESPTDSNLPYSVETKN